MAKEIIWGMIGTGNVTEVKSAPSFNKIPGSRLAAVGNRTPAKAEDYAQRHGIPRWYKDPLEVISDPEVNAVYIATPPDSHLNYALETIRAGKPVYIEKPMGLTWEECKVITQAGQEHRVPVFVAYYRRALPYFLKVKEILESGQLGTIVHIGMEQYFAARPEDSDRDNPPWRVVPEIAGGGYFYDVGCHALDILFYLFGDPLVAKGVKSNRAGLYEPEDSIAASLILPDAIPVSAGWDFVTPESLVRDRIEVLGEHGSLEFSVFSFDPIRLNVSGTLETFSPEQPDHIQMPLIQTIVEELQGTGQCPSTGETGGVSNRVMEEILGE